MKERYAGVLDNWFETGTEGVVWVLRVDPGQHDTNKLLHGSLKPIGHGDHLKVTAPDGMVVFDGIIRTDLAEGWTEYPLNPGHGQPAALGFWIHWTQHGWSAEAWATLFFGGVAYLAELITCTDHERATLPKPIPPPGCSEENWGDGV